jgi:hypothetical protein
MLAKDQMGRASAAPGGLVQTAGIAVVLAFFGNPERLLRRKAATRGGHELIAKSTYCLTKFGHCRSSPEVIPCLT